MKMGIPSYFRHLTRSLDGLLTAAVPAYVEWFCLDFNCMIYHVLQRPNRDESGECGGIDWENRLLDDIVKYTMKVVRHVNPKKGVFLAVDGVVPMAKIRQQRMRRFKGRPTEVSEAQEVFSKNAITPGTEFMRRLGLRLTRMAADHKDIRWKLSLADEPGEGEHKIMQFLRTQPVGGTGPVVVYGLDADLIVLSLIVMMEKEIEHLWLFREIVEDGAIKRDSLGEEEFHFFSVTAVAKYMAGRGYLTDYCNAMMLLGNDFLPISMTFRIREDGHEELCKMIREIRAQDDVGENDTTPIANLVTGIFERLAADEGGRFYRSCRKKLGMNIREGEEEGPVHWKGENVFFEERRVGAQAFILKRNWRDIYYRTCLGGVDKSRVVQEYWRGMKWVIDYYSGKPVNMSWMYSWHYPPLWEDLLCGFWDDTSTVASAPEASITPVEQLALVLPVWDWSLIPRGAKERRLTLVAPEWFPETFGLTHIGRRWLWECEPEIPIPSPGEMRARLR